MVLYIAEANIQSQFLALAEQSRPSVDLKNEWRERKTTVKDDEPNFYIGSSSNFQSSRWTIQLCLPSIQFSRKKTTPATKKPAWKAKDSPGGGEKYHSHFVKIELYTSVHCQDRLVHPFSLSAFCITKDLPGDLKADCFSDWAHVC